MLSFDKFFYHADEHARAGYKNFYWCRFR